MLAFPPGGATMRWVLRRGMLSSIWAPWKEENTIKSERCKRNKLPWMNCVHSLTHRTDWSQTGEGCAPAGEWTAAAAAEWRGRSSLRKLRTAPWESQSPRTPAHRTGPWGLLASPWAEQFNWSENKLHSHLLRGAYSGTYTHPAASLYPLVHMIWERLTADVAPTSLHGVKGTIFQHNLALADHHQRTATHLCPLKDVVLNSLGGRTSFMRQWKTSWCEINTGPVSIWPGCGS